MNILTIISTVYAAVSPFLSSPEGQKISEDLAGVISALVTQKASFSLAGYTASVSNSGTSPVHFELAQVAVAIAHIATGTVGDITVGSTVLAISKNAA